MSTHVLRFALVIALLGSGCRKKIEIVPDEAKHVTRTDSTEDTEGAPVKKREYQFYLNGSQFVCEGREFETEEAASNAAKVSIAQRPAERLQTDKAIYAVSGRSVWLKSSRELVWCMLATGKAEETEAAMAPVRVLFKKKYQQIAG